jgi:hypothetical protein
MAHGKTTATPRRDTRPLRYLHVSTDYRWVPVDPTNPAGPAKFAKVCKGLTYRKNSNPVRFAKAA